MLFFAMTDFWNNEPQVALKSHKQEIPSHSCVSLCVCVDIKAWGSQAHRCVWFCSTAARWGSKAQPPPRSGYYPWKLANRPGEIRHMDAPSKHTPLVYIPKQAAKRSGGNPNRHPSIHAFIFLHFKKVDDEFFELDWILLFNFLRVERWKDELL